MKYLAVLEGGQLFIEESLSAINHALANSVKISFYPIDVDPDTDAPVLGEKLMLSRGKRESDQLSL